MRSCDGILDQDAVTHDPAHPTRYLTSYDSGDHHLHPNEAIANAIDPELFKPGAVWPQPKDVSARGNVKKRDQVIAGAVNRMRVGLFFIMAWAVCASPKSAGAQQPTAPGLPTYKQPQVPIEARIDDLVGRMTLAEKVRQLDLYSGARYLVDAHSDDTHATPTAAFVPAKAEALFGSLGVGGIHDLYPTPTQANAIQQWVIAHNRLGIPALFIEEALHGYDTGTVFPAPIGLSGTWDVELAQETAASIASEARPRGVDMILAPVLDLARDPRWGRVEEDFGEDPYLTGQMGLAYVRGAQGGSLQSDNSVVAEPKHFAGHGSPEGGTNTSPVHMGELSLIHI